jgi:hypothetical protein
LKKNFSFLISLWWCSDYKTAFGMDGAASDQVAMATELEKKHTTLVLADSWWWAVHICLCAIAVVANLIFVVTVIHNRRRPELKTFVTAVITTVAVLDILDVLRILPVLSVDLFGMEIFRHVYCSLGVFHELAVAIFIVAISVAVCVQAGKEKKLSIINDSRASLAHKILIPIVLLITAGAAAPIYLFNYYDYAENWHSCTAPERALFVPAGTDSETFHFDLYSTLVSAFTYVFPVLILPLALPIATLRTCISRQCCVPRYKQPIGELIMTSILCLIYLGTIVGVMLPRIAEMVKIEELDPAKKAKAPLLWELGNNAIRPLVYFMTNPAVWDGLRNLCCRKKHQMVNDDEDEVEQPLAPVTTV